MKHHILLLSVAPIALLAAPAQAQTAAPATKAQTTDPNAPVEAQTAVGIEQDLSEVPNRSPVQASTTGLEDDQADPRDIVVTGYRASLGSAQAIKRNSDAILDAIVAQDIGKLPDNTAAESLARVTGIQVSRYSDEVTQVLVRGLPDVATTFNGRDIFTAENRRAALQDFPSGALAGLEVYKSGTADLLEPGLAGLINVRSRRPFDFEKGLTIAGGVRGTYNDQSKKFDPLGNLQISQRADTAIGEIGWLINAAYTQAQYRNAVRWADGFVTKPSDGTTVSPSSVGRAWSIPAAVGVYNDGGKRWRPAMNASVQWRPAHNLELYYDFLYQSYRGEIGNDWLRVPLVDGNPTLSNVVLREGQPLQVDSLTKTGGVRPEAYRSTAKAYTDTYQVAGGAKWDIGDAHLSTDLAYTTSQYGSDEWSFDSAFSRAPTADVRFFVENGSSFSLPGFDPADPKNYIWRGYFESTYRVQGKGWQWRADLDYQTNLSLIPKLQLGVRWTDRDASLRRGNRYAYTEWLAIPLNQTPTGDLALTQNAFRGNQGFTSWLMPTRDGIAGNAPALRQYAFEALQRIVAGNPTDQGYRDALNRFASPEVQLDPLATFLAREKTYAFYGQAKYEFDIGSVRFDGLVGTRVVNTVGRYSGVSSVTFNGVTRAEPRNTKANYVDILPNISLRIRPTEKLQVRFGWTITRTKPEFSQLNPAIYISQNTATPVPNPVPDTRFAPGLQGRPDAYGDGGNPGLQPLTSKNYDATVEYYFSPTASITAAVFYRDLKGFISNYTNRTIDPVYGLLEIRRPENAGKGRIKGFELGGQTFFDFLPGLWSGFGVQANTTYLQGEQQYPANVFANVGGTTTPPFVAIPNLSRWTYNVALFYEKGDVSTRLSWNNRDAYLNSNFVNAQGIYNGEGTVRIQRLDFSFNYNITKEVTIAVDAANLLAQPFNNYAQYGDGLVYPRDIRDEGRYYGVGVRFRF
ncbi:MULTISPECIES: TonB-dependent receptor [unclassified Sphingomonas]|uniref:TonB-dependent receptor n=1 Tax=unclassified Sphingomonas TaxID=196159 RepID=UPI0028560F4D|nr:MULTISPECIES: TonB-dependent receptor [unclassified Sphingomonas]MDR6113103.1 iron complex outermembrane receptor protein [Sphingomonas sp. SORGH_AS_0789]MDR6149535.1 iron complex outermembrane receptor protein [Sphingomonas sp. SORGH_AS_0742]